MRWRWSAWPGFFAGCACALFGHLTGAVWLTVLGGLGILYSLWSWVRKEKEQRKVDATFEKMFRAAFPDGEQQIEAEASKVAALLNNRVSKDYAKDILVHAKGRVLLALQSSNEITEAFERCAHSVYTRSQGRLDRDMARKVVLFVFESLDRQQQNPAPARGGGPAQDSYVPPDTKLAEDMDLILLQFGTDPWDMTAKDVEALGFEHKPGKEESYFGPGVSGVDIYLCDKPNSLATVALHEGKVVALSSLYHSMGAGSYDAMVREFTKIYGQPWKSDPGNNSWIVPSGINIDVVLKATLGDIFITYFHPRMKRLKAQV